MSETLALYLHIPFCAKHCAYCDFNTYVERAQSAIVQETTDAIRRDIERAADSDSFPPVSSVFFGGGTPTFLSSSQIVSLLETVRERFDVLPDAEISSEANPGSSDAEKFAAMRAAGFNRLSIGVQAFDDALLVALDRFHTTHEAERAYRAARTAGFENINLDLMFGLPQQTMPLWERTLYQALALSPEHLSLYALTLESGTRFERLHAGGKLPLPDEETEAAMYERSIEILTAAGYAHYEVSNFALPGFRCQHNQVYWRNETYLGFGPGAVSYWRGRRWKREKSPGRYIQKVRQDEDLTIEEESLDSAGALGETMLLGLRLRDGLPLQRIRERFGVEPLERFAPQIERLTGRGLLTLKEDTLRLTPSGLFLANDVLSAFLPDT